MVTIKSEVKTMTKERKRIAVTVTELEYKRLEKAANTTGQTVSGFVKSVLVQDFGVGFNGINEMLSGVIDTPEYPPYDRRRSR